MAEKIFDTNLRIGGPAGPLIISGTGAPEGVVTAPVGSQYHREDGGTGTTIYRKESGTGSTGWVATAAGGGGGSGDVAGPASATDNALARFDATTGKLIQNSAVELDDAGVLTLPATANPTPPSAGFMRLFAGLRGGIPWPAFEMPGSKEPHWLQPLIANGNYKLFMPASGTALTNIGMVPTGLGTVTALNVSGGSRLNRMKRVAYRITTAVATAVSGWRDNSAQLTIGGALGWEGGFWGVMHGGPDTGANVATHRFFMGLRNAAAPTDVEPSTQLLTCGIGYDAADTQVQFMHNDTSGVATKIPLGAGFPKPNVASSKAYRLRLYSPPGPTQIVIYEVEDMVTGAVASGTVTTNLPGVTNFITPDIYTSAGGTSTVIGTMVGPVMFQTED